jgi:putative flippase GtrA
MGLPASAHRLFASAADHIGIQAFRFLAVGVVAFAVDFSFLMLAVNVWQWNYLLAAALAYTIGLVLNYSMCVGWVFPHRRFQRRTPEFTMFALIGITGLGLTELILWSGHDVIGLDLRLAKFAALFAVATWNFVLRKTLVFSSR